MLGVRQQHDRSEAVARGLESPLGPEDVTARSLGEHEDLERAARRLNRDQRSSVFDGMRSLAPHDGRLEAASRPAGALPEDA